MSCVLLPSDNRLYVATAISDQLPPTSEAYSAHRLNLSTSNGTAKPFRLVTVVIIKVPPPNLLTRNYGIRQQAIYIKVAEESER